MECVNVERTFPCHVVRGSVTAYSEQPITDATVSSVSSALQAAIESGALDASDNRILSVEWRDLSTYPIPDDPNNGGPGNTPTQAPAGSPTGDQPTSNGNGTQGALNAEDDPVLETWMIIVIAVGGAILLCGLYLFWRNREGTPVYDDDDDSPSESSDEEFDDEDLGKKERTALVAAPAPAAPTRTPSRQSPTEPVIEEDEESSSSSGLIEQPLASAAPYQDQRRSSPPPVQNEPAEDFGSASDESSEELSAVDDQEDEFEDENAFGISEVEEVSFDDEPVVEDEMDSGSGSSSQGSAHLASSAKPTAADNPMVSPFGGTPQKTEGRWDEGVFEQSAPPPMDSTSDEFSSEYEEEAVDEEYEIEYVEEEENTEEIDDVDEDEESYTDEWEEEEEEESDEEEIVRDEPGGTPILPWLATDDE